MKESSFHVINFGCRATQADGAAIEQAFHEQQLTKSDDWVNSDVVVINTCTVTHSADSQARQMIRRVHRENPQARIVVTGCYAQRSPQEIAHMEGVTCVVGNSHKDQLVSLVVKNHPPRSSLPVIQPQSSGGDAAIYCSSIFESGELRSISDMSGAGRTRPVLKVQDGCSYRCSYCVIPYVRGDARSLETAEVVRQVRHLLDQGYKEIVLTGIHLGAYGRDLSERSSLACLIRALIQENRLERLRLSSVEPLEMTDEVIELIATSPKMAKHIHVPLQSGSDRVLRLMRRPYMAEYYSRLVAKIRRWIPESAIGADVMVGFPTETDSDHALTRDLLRESPITYLHVFPFSKRPGTPAALLRPDTPPVVPHQRSLDLRQLASEKNRAFRQSFLGQSLSAITLAKERKDESTEALSTNYLSVELDESGWKPNQLLDVRITGVTGSGLLGTPGPCKN